MFVRDVYPFYWSAYNQLVKRHGLCETFDESLLKNHYSYHAHSFRVMTKVFDKENIKVAHYESAQYCLGMAFMNMVGVPYEVFVDEPLRMSVNRSLTAYELDILTKLNSITGAEFCTELSDTMIYSRPELKYNMKVNPDNVELLRSRHNDDIKWINDTFFDGESTLSILKKNSKAELVQGLSNTTDDEYSRVYEETMIWAFKKLVSSRDDVIKLMLNKIQNLMLNLKDPEDNSIPEDFDPFYYLVHNYDVLFAGVDPYVHFLRYGKAEGRKWTWKERSDEHKSAEI